jgi:hypothetical protein
MQIFSKNFRWSARRVCVLILLQHIKGYSIWLRSWFGFLSIPFEKWDFGQIAEVVYVFLFKVGIITVYVMRDSCTDQEEWVVIKHFIHDHEKYKWW